MSTDPEATPSSQQGNGATRAPPRHRGFLSLPPGDAPNEGARLVRELRLRLSNAQIARKIGCNETAVRNWAEGRSKPLTKWSDGLRKFGIPIESFSQDPGSRDALTAVAATAIASATAPGTDDAGPAIAPDQRAAAAALAAAIESMTSGHARVLATALRRMLEDRS